MKFKGWITRINLAAMMATAVAWTVPAYADTDYRGLDQAVTNFFSVLDNLLIDVPNVSTVEAAVHALDSLTSANNRVADAGQSVVRLNPGFETNPPPRFTACFQRCTVLSTNYRPVTVGMGTLIKQYRKEPQFAAAVGRYQQSLIRVDTLLKMGVHDKD